MLQLTPGTEQLARRVAARLGREPGADPIRAALGREARALGIDADEPPVRRKMTAAEMLDFGRRVAARPLLDPRSPREITDDLNGTDIE